MAALALGVALASCKTGNIAESFADAASVATTLNVAPSRQRELGDEAAAHVNKMSLGSEDAELEAYLGRMTTRLAGFAGGNGEYAYRLYVLEDPQVNAFTPGGGHVFVTTGLVRALDNEAQMAAVIAHEIGHIVQSHVVRGIRSTVGVEAATSISASAIGIKSKLTQAVYDHSVLAAVNGHGPTFEEEADELGLKMLAAAGYDPKAMLEVFTTLRRLYGERWKQATFFHGSHATNEDRMEELEDQIAEDYGAVDPLTWVRDTDAYRELKARYPE